jgi:hypothetical protein
MEVLETQHKCLLIYDENPENLVNIIIEILDNKDKDIREYMNKDEHWFLDQKTNRKG